MRGGNQGVCRQEVIRVPEQIRCVGNKRTEYPEHHKEDERVLERVIGVESCLPGGGCQG